MSDYHALASPSSSEKWLNCANSLAMEIGQPEGDTRAADLGTDKHELLSLCLEFGKNAVDYAGHILKKGHEVTHELAVDVQTVLDSVRERIYAYELRDFSVSVNIEQCASISHITGELDATGRVDIFLCVLRPGDRGLLEIIDAKFGYQEVHAERNTQLMMYAAGILEELALTEDFSEVNLVIEQPLRGISEWTTTPDEIAAFVEAARPKAEKAIIIYRLASEGQRALKEEDFNPSEKTCQWCKAKAVCPALKAKVEAEIGASFEDIGDLTSVGLTTVVDALPVEKLGEIFPSLELVEDWIKAVRARIEHEIMSGRSVPGVKAVAGKKGNRAWASDEEAEALMKKFKLKQEQMYSFKLLGPKPILDALKDQPRRFKQIEALVVQPPGKPHIVVDSDKRPALDIKPVEDGFDTVDDLC